MKAFDTPILFLIFNRPNTTKQVFEKIREIQPAKLFVAGDGPRIAKNGEAELCKITREIITKGIDWECEVQYLFREENLGCGVAVSAAITWFFSNVEEGIILEDDTIPDISFFNYAASLLDKYRYDSEVYHISANTFHSFSDNKANDSSYYFSKFPFIWGWATWRRAWEKYEYTLLKSSSPLMVKEWIAQNFTNADIRNYWYNVFLNVASKDAGFTWDYQWFFSIWKNNGKVILPSQNLVTNIGWGANATHTTENDHHLANLKNFSFDEIMIHPEKREVVAQLEYNNYTNFYCEPVKKLKKITFYAKVKNKCINYLKFKTQSILTKILPDFVNMKKTLKEIQFYKKQLTDSVVSEKAKLHGPGKIINSSINDYTYLAPNAYIVGATIGKFCSIGPNLNCGYGIHPTNGISTSPMFYSTKMQNGYSLSNTDKIEENKIIEIGNDVFIGLNVTILDGVRIGDGAVIGAGAVVTNDIPPYAIAVGVPAKVVKYRFDDETIKKLLQLKWWDFPSDKLQSVEKNFFDVQKFLNEQGAAN